MKKKVFPLGPLTFSLHFFFSSALLFAQTGGEQVLNPELTIQALEEKVAKVKAAKNLAEQMRKQALDYLQKALSASETWGKTRADFNNFKARLRDAPGLIKTISAQVDQVRKVDPQARAKELAVSISDSLLPNKLNQLNKDVETTKGKIAGIDSEVGRSATSTQLRSKIKDSVKVLEIINTGLKEKPAKESHQLIQEARHLMLLAQKAREQELIALTKSQLENLDTLSQLLQAQRLQSSLHLSQVEALVAVLVKRQVMAQETEAKQARELAEAAQSEAAKLPPEVQKLVDVNLRLSEKWVGLTKKQIQVSKKLTAASLRLDGIKNSKNRQQKRLKAGGLTPALSLALRRDRKELSGLVKFSNQAASHRKELGQVAVARFDLHEKRREISELGKKALHMINNRVNQLPAEHQINLRIKARDQVNSGKGLLNKLDDAYDKYQKTLFELEFMENDLAGVGNEYALFIDRILLWSRSTDKILLAYPGQVAVAFSDMATPRAWNNIANMLRESFAGMPLVWGIVILFTLTLFLLRPLLRRRLSTLAGLVKSVKTNSILFTLEATGYTLLIAICWPLIPILAGYILEARVWLIRDSQGFTYEMLLGLVTGLRSTGFLWLGLNILGELQGDKSLGGAHFHWLQAARKNLLGNLGWFSWAVLPFFFLVSFSEGSGVEKWQTGPGRLAFLITIILAGFFSWRVFNPHGHVAEALNARARGKWLYRWRYFGFVLLIGLLLVFATMACLGFYYTAISLGGKMLSTVFFLIGLLVVHECLFRWLLGIQQRLAYQQAMEKRKKAKELAKEQGNDEEGEIPEPDIDYRSLREQGSSLLNVAVAFSFLAGLYAIWFPVLPALKVFSDIEMWTYMATVGTETKVVPITLGNCLLAILVFFVTMMATRNLPAILEMVMISRLKAETGIRYAYCTILRYLIIAVGLIIGFGIIGIGWAQVQFLVAALGVGLGFGLQEIFANFVSGLILLFERPIRVGDIVTIGDISGQVMKIRIRATTITDWDRKELIVPNKSFISGQLINWSLSDQITRVTIPVGIAYGSDTEKAEEIMRRLIKENSLVLDDPEPSILFLGFGDNTLDFSIRVYTQKVGSRMTLIDQIHHGIDREFRKAGVEIAFPQRDIHLDVGKPLEIKLQREKRKA